MDVILKANVSGIIFGGGTMIGIFQQWNRGIDWSDVTVHSVEAYFDNDDVLLGVLNSGSQEINVTVTADVSEATTGFWKFGNNKRMKRKGRRFKRKEMMDETE
jgi:hypothetical protein